jgi:reactive intermediate/imine deaminase
MKHVNPPGLPAPNGYSHVVEVSGGRTIYISGQVPLDREGNLIGADDFAAQTRQVFENLKVALAAAGATFDDVAKLTVFVTDVSRIQDFREVRNQYCPREKPASSLVQVVALFRADVMIEIEAIAVVG